MFVRERPTETLPMELATCPPGPDLAQLLATVDRESLSGYDRVILMQADHRQVAHYQAELYADIVAVADAETDAYSPDMAMDDLQAACAWEIRAAMTWTRRAAEHQLSFGTMLVRDSPGLAGVVRGADRRAQGPGHLPSDPPSGR